MGRIISEDRSGRREEEDRERQREQRTGGEQFPPFERERSKRTPEVHLVAAAEDVSCQDQSGQASTDL